MTKTYWTVNTYHQGERWFADEDSAYDFYLSEERADSPERHDVTDPETIELCDLSLYLYAPLDQYDF